MRASSTLRFLDRYLGIPLIFFLGLFRKRRPCPPLPSAPRIALLQTAAIGDTVLLSGPIADIRSKWPEGRITLFAGPSNYEAALLIPHIDVILLPVTSPLKAYLILSSFSFDCWIDFGSWPRINALYSFLATARYKIGFKTPGQHRHFIYDASISHNQIHEIQNYRNLLKPLQMDPHLPPRLIDLAASPPKNQIALHLFAGGFRASFKEWPKDHWVALIDALTEWGLSIVMTGSSHDRSRCEAIRSHSKKPHAVDIAAGTLTLAETAHVLNRSKALISVDTGILHLAASMGCSTLGLYGPTSPHRWGAIGPRVIHLAPKNQPRIEEISVEEVLTQLDQLLKAP